jgi:restriction system protein
MTPGYQAFMLPVLEALTDGAEHRIQDVIAAAADHFHLTPEDREQLLPSGRTHLYQNRIHWAATYLTHAGLTTKPRRAVIQLTDEGRRVLDTHPASIDVRYLERYPQFVEFRKGGTVATPSSSTPGGRTAEPVAETPEETLERAWKGLSQEVAADLLQRLLNTSPGFFEEIVVRLLVAMGYGGSYADAASVVGRSGDEGIDGIIKEDRLGLDAIYVQAKRWQGVVGRPVVQAFVGSLDGARARKGVLITTSSFSPDAKAYVRAIEKRVILIDGPTLTNYMIEYRVGVTPQQTYVVPKVDVDFFGEEEG